MPTIRPFRALRYDREAVEDLELVVAPPYDVIRPAQHQVLLLRHPRNIVRLDLPSEELGDEPGDRYRRAARLLAAWRSDGTFRKDPRPSIYVLEQTYRVPGTDVERTQRGFFARLRLESFGPHAGVLPHERTLAGPREDRYMLLRATGVNTSPVVGLYDESTGRAARLLAELTSEAAPVADVRDDDGTRHRLWIVPAESGADRPDGEPPGPAAELIALASAGPVTIADGHHRYETALRYRDERRMTRSCEEDPAFDYLLMLFLATGEPLTVLPTHRVVRNLGEIAGPGLVDRLRPFFEVTTVPDRGGLVSAFDRAALEPGGRGRFGAWWRGGGALLDARPGVFDAFFGAGHDALQSLDVARLGVVLERALGIDAQEVSGGRVVYTKSASEATDWVEAGTDGSDLAILLEPTPVPSIAAVARAGDLMPQKSTYFHPKALSGLLVNPLEW